MVAPFLLAAIPFVMPAPTPSPVALPGACNPPPVSTAIPQPPEIKSVNGVLSVTLVLHGDPNPKDITGMCWWFSGMGYHDFSQVAIPPTLHLLQGDELHLTLVNEMLEPPSTGLPIDISQSRDDGMDAMMTHDSGRENYNLMCGQPQLSPTPTPDPFTHRVLGYHRSPWNDTNMHFHGLNVSPQQPSDDVVDVMLCPRKTVSERPHTYEYVLEIPHDEPPGTYWYHPHAHGESERQVLSQLTGAIIVDPLVPGMPQKLTNRVIIVRDLGAPGSLRTRDIANEQAIRSFSPGMAAIRASYAHGLPEMNFNSSGFRFGPPAKCPGAIITHAPHFNTKELFINGVPLPPKPNDPKDDPTTTMTLGSMEYWRFVNTSADTVLEVEMYVNGKRTPIPVVSRDGDPLILKNGQPTWQPVSMNYVRLSPASRMEFYMSASVAGQILLRTRTIDSGCLGDMAFERNLMVVNVSSAAPRRPQVTRPVMPRIVSPVPIRFSDLGQQIPKHHRYFVFTEYNRSDEIEPDLYITELSNPKAYEHPYAMHGPPDVIVKSGTVEDWTIMNYTQEIHEFHIHQIHFLVLKGQNIERGLGQLLDTVDVPYGSYQGASGYSQFVPGAVTLRMDFRNPDIIGEFVYHCHILSHEDNGMMARIRVQR